MLPYLIVCIIEVLAEDVDQMSPISSCIICHEYVSWNCDERNSVEYVIHSSNY